MKILGIVGNNNPKSMNKVLLDYMAARYSADCTEGFEVVGIEDIPLFNAAFLGEDKEIPESVLHLTKLVEEADGVVIATAEYDHSITAALKSLLEWLSSATRPFTDKPVMIVGVSYGTLGSVRAQMNLRDILNAPGLQSRVLHGNEFLLGNAFEKFDQEGQLTDEDTVLFLDKCFGNFQTFVNND